MAKFSGVIGYVDTQETSPGVWTEIVTERKHVGDVIRSTKRWQSEDKLNDNLNVNNIFSIVANSFAIDNFYKMRYIRWMGASWKITNVEIQRPRLLLTIGGIYNG